MQKDDAQTAHPRHSGKFILVRHGESEGNRERRFTISSEVPLTELGRRQAHAAAIRDRPVVQPRSCDLESVRAGPPDQRDYRGRIEAADRGCAATSTNATSVTSRVIHMTICARPRGRIRVTIRRTLGFGGHVAEKVTKTYAGASLRRLMACCCAFFTQRIR